VSKSARRRQRRRQRQQPSVAVAEKVMIAPVGPQSRRGGRRRNKRSTSLFDRNPYLATILDPENVRGVKIPDAITLPTGTWTFTSDGNFTLDATGAGVMYVMPVLAVNSGTSTGQYAVITQSSPTSGNLYDTLGPVPPNANISNTIARLRPVSGSLRVWSTQPAINISGTCCSFYLPEGSTSVALGGGLTTFNSFTALPYNSVNHMADGGNARWMAGDPSEFDFEDVGGLTSLAGYTVTGAGKAQLLGLTPGVSGIGVAVTGSNASSQCRYRVVINYEITPQSDVLSFIDREPSPTNQAWLSGVNEFFVKSATSLFAPLASQAASAVPMILGRIGTSLATQAFSSAQSSFGPMSVRGRRPANLELLM